MMSVLKIDSGRCAINWWIYGVLEMKVDRRSSYVGSDEDVKPMLASHPNTAEYGEQLEVVSLIHCQNI
jgi:hypothetical protein